MGPRNISPLTADFVANWQEKRVVVRSHRLNWLDESLQIQKAKMSVVMGTKFLVDINQMLSAGMGVNLALKLVLICREVTRENVGDVQILGIHFQPTGFRSNVVNMYVTAVPSLL